MRKVISIILVLLIPTVFSACSFVSEQNDTGNLKLGVIETTGYKNKSYIHFFDEELNFLYKEEIEYASLSEPFDRPICKNGELYIIPKGEFEKREETCIINYNIKLGEYKFYDTRITSMNRLAVSNEFLFGVNCINGSSNLVRCSKDTLTDVFAKEFKDTYIAEMFVLNEKLYVIFHKEEANVIFAELSIETLEVVEQYDITSYGSPCNLIEYENKIYFSNQYEDETLGIPSSCLTVFDIEKKTFEQIQLTQCSPNNLIIKNGLLFVSHFDRVQNQGNKVSVVNLDTGNINTYELNHQVKQISAMNEYFYILGDNCMYKYNYDGHQFIQIKNMDIQVNKSNTFYYISSFFINE